MNSRRRFLKGAAGGTSSLALVGAASASSTCQINEENQTAVEERNEEPDQDELGESGEAEEEESTSEEGSQDDEEPEQERSVDEEQYGTVVDIVEAGADNDGNESITPVLREVVDHDTLVRFPPGRYYMDSQFRFTNFNNVGFVGNNATLVPANFHDFDGPRYRLFRMGTAANPGERLHFEGFHVDQTAPETGIRTISAEVTDGLFVQDVTIEGVHDSGTWGPGLFNITDSNGTGIVRRFEIPDGAVHVDETPNAGKEWRGPASLMTDPHHQGTLHIEDCVVGGYPGASVYVHSPDGQVYVDGGRYENSVALRLGVDRGGISNAEVVIDDNPGYGLRQLPIQLDEGTLTVENTEIRMPSPNGNAIRLRNGVEGASIKNCQISVGGSEPTTAIRVNRQAGPTYIEDVDIDLNVSGNAIKILGTDAGEVGVQNVTITGDASGSAVRHAIYCERNSCRFRHLEVDQPGSNRNGLFLSGEDYVVYGSNFETTDDPIVIDGHDAWIGENYASSTNGASVRITGSAGNVTLRNNSFPDGIIDRR